MGKVKGLWEEQQKMNGNEPVMTEIDELLNNHNLDLLQSNKYMGRVEEIIERIIDDIIQPRTSNNVCNNNDLQLSDRKNRRQQASQTSQGQHPDSSISSQEEKEESNKG